FGAEPACERGRRAPRLLVRLLPTVGERCAQRLRRDGFRGRLARAYLRGRDARLQLGFLPERIEERPRSFRVATLEPGGCYVAAQLGTLQVEDRNLAPRFRARPRFTQVAFLAAHEVLRHADAAHRHAVGGEAPAVGTLDGHVLDTHDEFGVGILAGGRHQGGGGLGTRALRGELRRALLGDAQG